eukprot:gene15086-16642_t
MRGSSRFLQSFFSLFIITGLTKAFTINLKKTIDFKSDEGSVAVYDKAMPTWLSTVFESFFKAGERWTYQFPDELSGIKPREENNMHWVSPISPTFLMKSKPWLVLKKVAKDFSGRNDLMAYRVTGTMLRRGDSPDVIPGLSDGGISMRLFLSPATNLSNMVFYDSKEEIVKSVKAKFNRIVIWNSSLSFQCKPPDYDSIFREYSLLIRLSPDAERVHEEEEYIKKLRAEEKKESAAPFPFANLTRGPFPKEYYDEHCTRKFYDARGNVIAFFDDIFSEKELATLRTYMIKHNSGYSASPYMVDESQDADNVNWICSLQPEVVTETRVLEVVKGLTEYLSGENGWHPYDVSMNMIQNTFHTRIHEDCVLDEFEYTLLLYLNPDWGENNHGETIFLNQIQEMILNEKDEVIQDKDYETIVAVRPKYGRIAVFRNNIPHSARPPSPDFHGARYTFAVKVSRTKKIALSKILQELLEFKADDQDEGAKLYYNLQELVRQNKYPIPVEELQSNITKYRALRMEVYNDGSTVNALLRSAYSGKDKFAP